MRLRLPAILALAALASFATAALAARPVEKRSDATYVVTGTVAAVYTEDGAEYRGHVVAIRIEAVEKGTGLKRGEVLYASCYKRKADAPGINWDSGHEVVPKVGARIKAFINRGDGKNEGVFPDWVDVLAEPKVAAAPSPRRSP